MIKLIGEMFGDGKANVVAAESRNGFVVRRDSGGEPARDFSWSS